jgi:hypothetical protein
MFTLTIAGDIPSADAWESTPAQFPTEELYAAYIKDLAALQSKYRLRNTLCPDNFRGNRFANELLVKVVEYSRTATRKLISDNVDITHTPLTHTAGTHTAGTHMGSTQHSVQYYTYLELYRKVFSKVFINRIRTRYEDIKSKAVGRRKAHLEEVGVKIKGVPLRSFHVLDNSGDSSKAFRITINYVEAETGSSIAWNHLSTYSHERTTYDRVEHVKDSTHWTKGVEGDGTSLANIRAWKNKITTVLKNVDVIVINAQNVDTSAGSGGSAGSVGSVGSIGSVNSVGSVGSVSSIGNVSTDCTDAPTDGEDASFDFTASAISFVLMNLNSAGSAIISLRISSLANASTVSLVHLFALCFESSQVIQTVAEDRLFLCGSGFKSNVISRHYSHMVAACQTKNSIFSSEYMNGEAFTGTVEKLINVIRAASGWRLLQYKKMLEIYEKLSVSESTRLLRGHVEKVLEEYYPDDSSEWKASVGL